MLDIWPAFPIVVFCHKTPNSQLRGILNVIAALKCPDRVCEIDLQGIPNNLLKRVAAINIPFPALTTLKVSSESESESESGVYDWPRQPIIRDSFLGGMTPRLRSLDFHGIPFPAPQKLLLSATDLVTLRLERIPAAGYLPPEEVITCLSTLTKLEELALGFQTQHYVAYETNQTLPPAPSAVLPALTSFRFQGDYRYLKVLITRTTFPLLDNLDVTFTRWRNVDSPPLLEFVNRIETLDMHDRADISFHNDFVNITLSQQEMLADCRKIQFGVLCKPLDLQLLYLNQFCSSSLPSLPTLENLYIRGHGSSYLDYEPFSTENLIWFDILHPFTSVKKLYLSGKPTFRVVHALQGIISVEMATEVLPALQNISFSGYESSGAIQEAIGNLVATLQLSGRSVSVHY
jgi:hypothetical protein